MNKEEYNEIIKKIKIKKNKTRKSLLAFLMGGFISMSAEILNLFLKNQSNINEENRVIIVIFIFIFIGALLTGLGLFDNLVQIFGAGLFIPITGFANAVTSEAMEYKSEGPIYGIGANMFKLAGSVLTYGVITSLVLSLIYYLLNG